MYKRQGLHQTNLGVFRAYLERYLRNEVPVNKGMTLMVRQLQPTETVSYTHLAFAAPIFMLSFVSV